MDVTIITSDEHEVSNIHTLAATLQKIQGLYVRDNSLVWVDGDTVRTHDIHSLAFALSRHVWYQRPGKDSPRYCLFPERWLRLLLHSRQWPGVPRLQGLVRVPIVQEQRVIISAGYDARSQLYLVEDYDYDYVASNPSHQDAVEAYQRLLDFFADVAVAEDAYRHNIILALATIAYRYLAGHEPVPAFLVDAPSQAAGKTTLARVLYSIVTGKQAPLVTDMGDTEEWRKSITSLLAEDAPAIIVDNIARLTDPSLAAYITAGRWKARLLGTSTTVEYPARSVIIATGNNVELSADMLTRVIPIRLDASRAHWRSVNPVQLALDERRRIISDMTLIFHAWRVAGAPVYPLDTRFAAWAEAIASALLWAGAEFSTGDQHWRSRADVDAFSWGILLEQIQRIKGTGTTWAALDAAELFEQHKELAEHLPDRMLRYLDRPPALATSLGRELARLRDRVFDVGGRPKRLRCQLKDGRWRWIFEDDV